ncbi:MAG: metallophosphoesterase family protein [Solirubrobacteraceae bacterium]
MPLLQRRGFQRAGLAAIVVACTLVGAWAGPRVAGPSTYATSVADVQLRVSVSHPSRRGLDLYVPLADWGLRVPLVDAPLRVRAEPRRVNRGGVVELVTDGGRDRIAGLRAELDDALASAALRFALASVAGGLAGGLLSLLLWQALGVRGWRLAIAPAGAVGFSLLVAGALAVWSTSTFDASRLERPDYYASGVELERILVQASALRSSGEKYADRVDNAVRAITGLLNDRGTGANPLAPEAAGGTRRLVLASDIHNNLLTLRTLRRYAEGNLTVLAGDFTINGGRIEAPLAELAGSVGDPVVAVSGNHDSPGIMNALRRGGATVLDHRAGVRSIDGVRIAGFEDPLMSGGREFPAGIRAGISFGDIPNGDDRFADAVRQRFAWWQALATRPSVLVVHQASIARALADLIWREDPAGAPLVILAGHTHRQRLDRYGPITVVDSGSIGGGGLFGIGEQDVGLAMLDLSQDGALEATDLVSQNPSTSAARARRVITASPDCDETLVFCHDGPDVEPELESSATP